MKIEQGPINVALVDDHVLLRGGLAALISTFEPRFRVCLQASDGRDMIRQMEKLDADLTPDIVLVDIIMSGMDGGETTFWLKQNKPDVKVLILSMYDSDITIMRMLKNGARGYLMKDIDAEELLSALNIVVEKGYYYSEPIVQKLARSISNARSDATDGSTGVAVTLSDREREVLRLMCSEFTLKEMADRLYLSPRTVDGYRDSLFQKFNVKSRVGLVLVAIKLGIFQIN
ncbi:response regulator transcription factor [Puia sp.]|jgi:DNA-binding NarL/FixJ family response regulator|uniref:response regulator transcription factor n=1 Tax=Puia sp. TaxID=2045100 RepID=UPI002F418ED5